MSQPSAMMPPNRSRQPSTPPQNKYIGFPKPRLARGHADDPAESKPKTRMIDVPRIGAPTRKRASIQLAMPSPEDLGIANVVAKAETEVIDPTTRELRELGIVSLQINPVDGGFQCVCRLRTNRPGLKHIVETDIVKTQTKALQIALDEARRWVSHNR